MLIRWADVYRWAGDDPEMDSHDRWLVRLSHPLSCTRAHNGENGHSWRSPERDAAVSVTAITVVAKGVGGTMPRTDPLSAVLAKDRPDER